MIPADAEPAAPQPQFVTIRPTMSKAELLIACQWPWGRQRIRSVGSTASSDEAARFGSAFHEVMAAWISANMPREIRTSWVNRAAERFSIDTAELLDHVSNAAPFFLDWIRSSNQWGVDLTAARLRVELPLAYNVKKGTARVIALPNAAHEYEEATAHELPGTLDLVIDQMPEKYRSKGAPHFILLDHKTGEYCDLPQDSQQIKGLTNAYAGIVPYPNRKAAGAVFHAPRGHAGLSAVYDHEYSDKELAQNRKSLLRALGRIGDGSLTPNPGCQWCPALSICPTQTSALVKLGDGSLSKMTPEILGAQHQAKQLIDRYLKQWSDDAKAWVKMNGPGVRPDGMLVDIVEKSMENLSKASIVRALGSIEGEKMIAKLRKLGCIEISEREELRAVKDREDV